MIIYNKTMKKEQYDIFCELLHSELLKAMGCTEPIAIAYLASVTRDLLGEDIKEATIEVSGNIAKNVKSVIVPNTGKMKGIKVAVAAGILFGKSDKKLEVIADIEQEDCKCIDDFINNHEIKIELAKTPYIFDLILTLRGENHVASCRIVNYHTNIVFKKLDDEVIFEKDIDETVDKIKPKMTVEEIVEYAKIVDLNDIKDVLDVQIESNMNIALEGFKNDYGANIGKVLLNNYENSVYTKMKAYAASASDARMNGCELPVVIVSGSGNQGITASVPVIVYAREKGFSDEELYRALVVSNLVTIHLKKEIGRLSAYCGATSAGVGAGAGIAFIESHDYVTIAHTIVNALGIISGMVCDGAKASCAAKIQAAIDSGIFGYQMYKMHQEFKGGDGLIEKGVEKTIANISRLASQGMAQTDAEIIDMMIENC